MVAPQGVPRSLFFRSPKNSTKPATRSVLVKVTYTGRTMRSVCCISSMRARTLRPVSSICSSVASSSSLMLTATTTPLSGLSLRNLRSCSRNAIHSSWSSASVV
jgi:hypothetical protein